MNLQLQTTVYTDGTRQTTRQSIPFAADEGREHELINLYPDVTYQKFRGFGGAVTDSAAYMYAQLNTEQKKHLLDTYFKKDEMGYRYVRISIDSCDFSLAHYEADGDENDADFAKFSFDRVEQYILPMLRDAEKACGGKLEIMLAPWSPPAYMKTTGERNHGGKDVYKRQPQQRALVGGNVVVNVVAAERPRGADVGKVGGGGLLRVGCDGHGVRIGQRRAQRIHQLRSGNVRSGLVPVGVVFVVDLPRLCSVQQRVLRPDDRARKAALQRGGQHLHAGRAADNRDGIGHILAVNALLRGGTVSYTHLPSTARRWCRMNLSASTTARSHRGTA